MTEEAVGKLVRLLLRPAIALTALAFLVAASPAAADDPISNPSVASDGAIYRALDAAEWFWAAKDAKPCHGGSIFEYDETGPDAGKVAARGSVGICGVWFERGYVQRTRDLMRRHPTTALAALCYVAIHERGHNLGYVHGQEMWDAMAGAERFCRQWAARVTNPRYAPFMKRSRPQPNPRSRVGLAAHQATGAGKHGGSARAVRRRNRQNTKRALRAGSEAL